jgi:hypothetical protein
MGLASLVNGHHGIASRGANADLSQTPAFFTPPVFQFTDIPSLDVFLGYHHPGVLFAINT